MSTEIIPQETAPDLTDLVVECSDCAGMGEIGTGEHLRTCSLCKGKGRLPARAASPIVNLCSSGFVEALERTSQGLSAISALETHLDIVEMLRQLVECKMCEGSGNLPDPFEDDPNATETCNYCKGEGEVVPTEYENLIGDVSLELLKTLATDLRAALDATKGGSS